MTNQAKELKAAGLRATAPRMRVLEVFERRERRHLTAEDVYQELSGANDHRVSLATVYRVLAQFEEAGLLIRHHLDTGRSVFELSRLGNHNHLICIECGAIKCFTDEVIDRRQHDIADKLGFVLKDYCLYTYANCTNKDCPNRDKEKP